MAAVIGRYARAFADVAVAHKLDAGKTVAEMSDVAALIEGNRELRNVLQNPSVAHNQKLRLLDAVMKLIGGPRQVAIGDLMNARKSASDLLRNFLAVLIDHRRIGSLGEIVKEFKKE